MQAMSVIQSRDGGVCIRGNFQATEKKQSWVQDMTCGCGKKGLGRKEEKKNDEGQGEVRNHILVKF